MTTQAIICIVAAFVIGAVIAGIIFFNVGIAYRKQKAEAELGWKAEFGIEEMCRDTWNWQKNNPKGYDE